MQPVIAQYIRPEVVAYAVFFFVLLLTLGGALIAVIPKSIIHNVFGLATSLVGVAGLFIYLGSEFLAMMEILIYVGAICIAIVFAIMLSQPMHLQIPPRLRPKVFFSFVVSLVVFISFTVMVVRTPWEQAVRTSNDWGVKRLGTLLLTRYELLFELISLVLLMSIIGAVITAATASSEKAPGSRDGEEDGV
ncbi:MAG: NADH-quinone oxidoreductase subunit J [Desulfarculus sp.]|jgi:NADH-quinone oxidoreductase subunit J|nr:MAG: NADH-quinone oxidoreductase subunit J [Desulfarculus sp.]